MPSPSIRITEAQIIDLRVPTSDRLLGADPFLNDLTIPLPYCIWRPMRVFPFCHPV